MGSSIDAITADCYDGTTCLINKFDIKDDKQLSLIEGQITFAKGSELERNPVKGNFDFEHYRAIHKYLFDELYEWAGKIRTVDMSKKGTNFAKANEIEKGSLNMYSINLNQKVLDGKIDPVIGRQEETNRLIEVLLRRTKNNPCLIGEPGVRKNSSC